MTEQEELNEKSFLNKKVRYRLIVIAAGAFMNFVLAVVIIWGVMFTVGTHDVSTEPVVGSDRGKFGGCPGRHGNRATASSPSAACQSGEWKDISKYCQ
jgi:regulator of sigma E protease